MYNGVGVFSINRAGRRGQRKPHTFTFLDITHYCSRSKNSKFYMSVYVLDKS